MILVDLSFFGSFDEIIAIQKKTVFYEYHPTKALVQKSLGYLKQLRFLLSLHSLQVHYYEAELRHTWGFQKVGVR